MTHHSAISSPRMGLGSQGRVLVVDDNIRNLQGIVNCLNLESFDVVGVSSGDEALHQLKHRVPDLILLDVVMPGLNGFELCRIIKESEEWGGIPILFLSGDSNLESINQAFEIGAVDYIAKPFQRAELVARVRTHIELVRRRNQSQQYWQSQVELLQNSVQQWQAPLHRLQLLAGELMEAKKDGLPKLAEQMFRDVEFLIQEQQTFLTKFSNLDQQLGYGAEDDNVGSDDLKKLVGQWYVTAKRKNVDLRIKAPSKNVRIHGGMYAISTILEAVLSNAVHFTPRDGEIEVIIKKESNRVRMTIRDSGPGFPQDYLSQPFTPYLRKINGVACLGVGLATAKKTASRIGAELEIDTSAKGGGLIRLAFEEVVSKRRKEF